MSRSYKHTPYSGDRKNKYMKRLANKTVRQRLKDEDFSLSAAEYKKMFCSYDICDYYWIERDFESFHRRRLAKWYEWRHLYDPFPTREESWELYSRWYLRK